MKNINKRIMAAVIARALVEVGGNIRWINAIAKAVVEIETNPAMIWYDAKLLIVSPSSKTYQANGTCSCKAFTFGQPCWHRAAARLVSRYHDTV